MNIEILNEIKDLINRLIIEITIYNSTYFRYFILAKFFIITILCVYIL